MPFIKEHVRKSFLFNLLVVLSLCCILYISFFTTLHWLTKHGQEIAMPSVTGKDMGTAVETLKQMRFDVIVDSTYEPALKPLTVLKQVPDSGARVKEGRTVFLTVNMLTPPMIPMPNLINLSYRSAEMMLRNNKLLIGDTSSRPDIAAGAVLEQRYKGAAIRPGEMILQGSKISLVIGNGLGNTEWNVTCVAGMSVDEARTILNQYNLQIQFALKDEMSKITDTATAVIVDQTPRDKDENGKINRIKMGDVIYLTIDQNPEERDIHQCNTNSSTDVSGDGTKPNNGE